MPCIPMPSLLENSFKAFSAEINGKSYTITVRWSDYNECAFCQIKRDGENLFDDDYPLVCGGIIDIDHRKLPPLVFGPLDKSNLPPIKETFSAYGFYYNDNRNII